VRFHPDGTCIASGSDDKKIKIWDIRSKRLIQHYDAHAAPVSSISFHPSGNYLLSTGHDGLVKIWDLKLGQIIYTLHGHEGPAISSGFSQCGDFFATGGTDAIVMVWQSNITSMSEEFDKLNKSELSHMKSNKKLVNETSSKFNESTEKFKVSANSKMSKKNTKYSVIKPEQKEANSQVEKTQQGENNNSTAGGAFAKLPGELASTFEKMISQMDLISNTIKIFSKRIETIENQIGEICLNKKAMNDNSELKDLYNQHMVSNNYNPNQYENNYTPGGASSNLPNTFYETSKLGSSAPNYMANTFNQNKLVSTNKEVLVEGYSNNYPDLKESDNNYVNYAKDNIYDNNEVNQEEALVEQGNSNEFNENLNQNENINQDEYAQGDQQNCYDQNQEQGYQEKQQMNEVYDMEYADQENAYNYNEEGGENPNQENIGDEMEQEDNKQNEENIEQN